jgi:hypothetical protein
MASAEMTEPPRRDNPPVPHARCPEITTAATHTGYGGTPPNPAERYDLHAGRVLSVLSVAPALAFTGWLLASFPMVVIGQFRPATVVPLATVCVAALLVTGTALAGRSVVVPRSPWWATAATVAVAVGFAGFTAATHSEQVVVRRDPGAYAQIGYWLTHHPSKTYQVPVAAFGPSPGDLSFASPAFYEHGTTIIPQFMTGWPTALAGAGWLAGWSGILLLPALVGGCAVLAIAGLAARLIGPRWAPLAALLTAVTWPVLRVSQTTFSEPLAFVLLAAGICLLIDVLTAATADATGSLVGSRRRAIRLAAFAAGLMLAGGELVRVDIGVDFALVLPAVAWLWATRRPGVWPFVAGALLGGGLGAVDAAFVTRPYVEGNWSSVRLMLTALAGMIIAVTLGAALARRLGTARSSGRWWRPVPAIAAGALALGEVALVVRPFVSVDHSTVDPGVISYTASMQGWLGLPVDGTRGYAEQSLWWVSWYLGWPLITAAGIAAVILTWRILHGHERAWIPALAVYAGSSLQSLVRPGITPDHPWADRRLVVEVIPGMILFATWLLATATRRAEAAIPPGTGWIASIAPAWRSLIRAAPAALATLAVVAFLVPAIVATAPLATRRTELGELAAAAKVCQALNADDSVVTLDSEWFPIVRGQCGLPIAELSQPSPATVQQVVESIRLAGRTPVVLAGRPEPIEAQGLQAAEIVVLRTRMDQQQLVRRPTSTQPLYVEAWLARP